MLEAKTTVLLNTDWRKASNIPSDHDQDRICFQSTFSAYSNKYNGVSPDFRALQVLPIINPIHRRYNIRYISAYMNTRNKKIPDATQRRFLVFHVLIYPGTAVKQPPDMFVLCCFPSCLHQESFLIKNVDQKDHLMGHRVDITSS